MTMQDPLANPPPDTPAPGRSALSLFSKNQADIEALSQREQAEMGPAVGRAQEALAQPKPQLGAQTKPPPAPKTSEMLQPSLGFLAAANFLAAIAGAFSRQGVTSALNAFGGAVKGFKQGNIAAADEKYKEWKAASEQALEANRQVLQEYKAAMEERSANIDEAMAQVQLIATKYKDPIMMQAAEAKNLTLVAQIIERQEAAGRKFEDAVALLEQKHQNQMDEIQKKMDERFGNLNTVEGLKKFQDTLNAQEDPAKKQQLMDLFKMMHGGVAAESRERIEAGKTAGQEQTPEERASIAGQAASGMPLTQVVPGWGTPAVAARRQARKDAIQLVKDQTGMSDAEAGLELARRTVEFQAGKVSVGQLNTMLGATRQAVSQLDFNIEKAKEQIKRLGSFDMSPMLNALARGEEKWTGNPAYSSLYFYMNAVATESARILAGGQASRAQLHEGARLEAEKWANINMTPAMFNDVAKSMHDEGQFRIKSFEDAMKAQRGSIGGGATPPGSAAPSSMSDDDLRRALGLQ